MAHGARSLRCSTRRSYEGIREARCARSRPKSATSPVMTMASSRVPSPSRWRRPSPCRRCSSRAQARARSGTGPGAPAGREGTRECARELHEQKHMTHGARTPDPLHRSARRGGVAHANRGGNSRGPWRTILVKRTCREDHRLCLPILRQWIYVARHVRADARLRREEGRHRDRPPDDPATEGGSGRDGSVQV
jgi:hypothetical protein